MKNYLLFLGILFYSFLSPAQLIAQKFNFGAYIGLNSSKPINTEGHLALVGARLDWLKSARPAFFLHIPLGRITSLNSEVALYDMGRKLDYDIFKVGDNLQWIVLMQKDRLLQFNQMVSFEIPLGRYPILSFLMEIGPYYSYGINCHIYSSQLDICLKDGNVGPIKKEKLDNWYDENEYRSRIGIAWALGLKYKLGNGFALLNCKYEQTLNNTYMPFPYFDFSHFNRPRVMAFSIGYMY